MAIRNRVELASIGKHFSINANRMQRPVTTAERRESRRLGPTLRSLFMLPLLFVVFLTASTSIASQGLLLESQAKALLLYKFAKFTTWPANSFPGANSPLVIGVIGPNPFKDYLDEFKDNTVNGRRVVIRYFAKPRDYRRCHILFCNVGTPAAFRDLQEELNLEEQHVLTVGDFPGFAASGGILGVTFRGKNLALELNQQAANRAKVFLSENLVRLTEPVP